MFVSILLKRLTIAEECQRNTEREIRAGIGEIFGRLRKGLHFDELENHSGFRQAYLDLFPRLVSSARE